MSTTSRHGCPKSEAEAPPDFEKISKKCLFFQFRRVKTKFHHFGPPPGKNFGKMPYWSPLGKNHSDAHASGEYHFTFLNQFALFL